MWKQTLALTTMVAGVALALPKTAPKPAALKGHYESNASRVSIYNDSDVAWTRCELHLPGGKQATLGDVPAHDQNGTMWFKFQGPTVALDSLLVTCDEGETRFLYSDPRAPGKLRGHIERNMFGRITLYNDSDVAWHRCVLKQPDKSQYILSKLDPHSDEGIMGVKFTVDVPPVSFVDIECDQGKGHLQR